MDNKFKVLICSNSPKENGYNGPVVAFQSTTDPFRLIFFPVELETAKILNYLVVKNIDKDELSNEDANSIMKDITEGIDIIDNNKDLISIENANEGILGIYETMLESWSASNRFLSGILFNIERGEETDKVLISCKIILSGDDGMVDCAFDANLMQALVLSTLLDAYIIFSEELLSFVTPVNDDDEKENQPKNNKKFPKDDNVVNIVKNIMSNVQEENNKGESK